MKLFHKKHKKFGICGDWFTAHGKGVNLGKVIKHDLRPEHSNGIRRMMVDNYSVFYVIKEDRVIVTDVLYSAANIEERLKG